MPSISVIIPTYNRPLQLALCLRALEALDFPRERFEVMVVDDGSVSPLPAIEELGLTLEVTLIRQEHQGPAAARNNGAHRARGRSLLFLDDDCLPEPNWLRALAARVEPNRQEAVAGKTVNGCPDNIYDCASHLMSYQQYDRYENESAPVDFLATNNLAMPADLFHAAGGFRTDLNLAYEDREFCDRWLRLGHRLAYAPEAVVRHCRSMTLRSFCRQHWIYGRMASRYYNLPDHAASGRIRGHLPGMYRDIVRQAFRERHGAKTLPLLTLLAISQLTAGCGFLAQGCRDRRT